MPSDFRFLISNFLLNSNVGPEPAAEPEPELGQQPERELVPAATQPRQALDLRRLLPSRPAHAAADRAAIQGSIAADAANSGLKATSCRRSRSGNR